MRNVDGLGQGLEVLEEALLRRLVVVGGHDQGGVGPALGGPAREAEGFLGAVRARARHDLGPAGGRLDHGRDHPLVLGVGKGGALARRAHRAEAGGAGRDLELDIPLQGLDIDLAVAKGRDHGHGQAGKIFTSGGHGGPSETAVRTLTFPTLNRRPMIGFSRPQGKRQATKNFICGPPARGCHAAGVRPPAASLLTDTRRVCRGWACDRRPRSSPPLPGCRINRCDQNQVLNDLSARPGIVRGVSAVFLRKGFIRWPNSDRQAVKTTRLLASPA